MCSDAAEHRRRVETRGAVIPGLPQVTWRRVLDCGYEPWQGDRLVVDTARLTPDLAIEAVMAALPASPHQAP